MTNKNEIIIDRVNVSECEFLDEWKHCNICKELIKTIPNRHQCLIEVDLRCEYYSNCYYKQLKRLQEKYNTLTNKFFNSETDKTHLEQENEKLTKKLQQYEDMKTKGLEEFKDVGGCRGCGLQLQLNQDIEDIKKLKQNAQDTYDRYKALIKSFEISNSERSKYKHTLEEIEAISKKFISELDYKYKYEKGLFNIFITKINKVLKDV